VVIFEVLRTGNSSYQIKRGSGLAVSELRDASIPDILMDMQ
jgi:hypothetical protein